MDVPRRLVLALIAVPAMAACQVNVGEKGASVAIASETATEEWTRSYALRPGGTLAFESINGPVTVGASTTGTVEMRIVRSATAMAGAAARQALTDLTITESQTDGRVHVALTSPKGTSMARPRIRVVTEIRVPAGLVTEIRSRNGDVTVKDVAGAVTVALTNGSISFEETTGNLTASAANGRVRAELPVISGTVDLTARNGTILLGLGPAVKADVEANALNGGVSVDPQLAMAVEGQPSGTVSSHLVGRMNGGGPRISVQVSNGTVRIGTLGSTARDDRR